MAGIVLKDLMLLHIFTTKTYHPQALMKKKPAILFLLPVLPLLLSGSGLKAGAADRATYFESIFIDLILNLSSNPNKDEQHYE